MPATLRLSSRTRATAPVCVICQTSRGRCLQRRRFLQRPIRMIGWAREFPPSPASISMTVLLHSGQFNAISPIVQGNAESALVIETFSGVVLLRSYAPISSSGTRSFPSRSPFWSNCPSLYRKMPSI